MSEAPPPSLEATRRMEHAFAAFVGDFPSYAGTRELDRRRQSDYERFDRTGHIYLDYTGGGQYAACQITEHVALLQEGVFGNPHSNNPTSRAMTELVERARRRVLDFFHADPEEYVAIFTANASGALKLVGESYPFGPGGRFALAADDHNSVNGIREFARSKGAAISYVALTPAELRLDTDAVNATLTLASEGADRLFAFPAQSNYSGVQHPLSLVDQAQAQNWDVLLDAAAFAPTNRLDLTVCRPEFVTLSFYKIFGYPTGIGALLARRRALRKLQRPWFAGGTIRIASVRAGRHIMGVDEAAFEDGTVNYLNIPAVEIGLRHVDTIGMDVVHERVRCLTGWLLGQLPRLRHENGRPLVQILGPRSLVDRGGTIALSFFDPTGRPIPGHLVEHLAGLAQISLRTGCFCNPGAGETAFDLSASMMQEFFTRADSLDFQMLVAEIASRRGVDVSAVRISVGLASNFADVYRFVRFAETLRDQTELSLAPRMSADAHSDGLFASTRDAA